jgi:hypothetical protein
MFSALASEESRRFYMWLPLAFAGLLMILFGIGQWGRWWHLATLASIPLCLVGVPWFSNKFTQWYIDWCHSPFLYVGTLIFVSVVAFSIRWLGRGRVSPDCSENGSTPKTPLLATKIAIVILGVGGAVYGVDYLRRSLNGRFEPEIIGLTGVKWYAWAPNGFVTEFKWNHSRKRFYYGLWLADALFWHRSEAASSGRYPVNEVSGEDIGKVYRAWK